MSLDLTPATTTCWRCIRSQASGLEKYDPEELLKNFLDPFSTALQRLEAGARLTTWLDAGFVRPREMPPALEDLVRKAAADYDSFCKIEGVSPEEPAQVSAKAWAPAPDGAPPKPPKRRRLTKKEHATITAACTCAGKVLHCDRTTMRCPESRTAWHKIMNGEG
jgi:hypothetical protein